jgi:hypothetical protein
MHLSDNAVRQLSEEVPWEPQALATGLEDRSQLLKEHRNTRCIQPPPPHV